LPQINASIPQMFIPMVSEIKRQSETIIANAEATQKRQQVIIATKVGAKWAQKERLSKKYILAAVEDSLQRLQTDYIDLYQSHWMIQTRRSMKRSSLRTANRAGKGPRDRSRTTPPRDSRSVADQ